MERVIDAFRPVKKPVELDKTASAKNVAKKVASGSVLVGQGKITTEVELAEKRTTILAHTFS
jgi:hypothetical protein